MNLGKQFYDLHLIDLDLEAETEKLRYIESQISNDQVLAEAKAELEGKQQRLAELQKEQQTAEWLIDDIEAKVSPIREKLYTGSVKNPKELMSMQQQEEQLKSQLRKGEERVLEIMSQVEEVQKEVASKTADVKRQEEEWQKRQQLLLAEQAELKMVIDKAEKRRSQLTAIIEPAHLELYETLQVKKRGQVVAKIEQGRCQGCRISLPTSELMQARVGELVQCSSCERILYLG